MPRVQLLSFPQCPHVDDARRALCAALRALGLPIEFEEVDLSRDTCAEALRAWGSPTVLIDGGDAVGAQPAGAWSCRLYVAAHSDVSVGVPPMKALEEALERARSNRP